MKRKKIELKELFKGKRNVELESIKDIKRQRGQNENFCNLPNGTNTEYITGTVFKVMISREYSRIEESNSGITMNPKQNK